MRNVKLKKCMLSVMLVILSMLQITVTASQITPPTYTDDTSDLIYYASNNLTDGGITLSNNYYDTVSSSLKGGESLSNDNLCFEESLSTYVFPEINSRNTSAVTNVSGTINASSLDNYAELVLTGNTNLYMDVNKPLKSIKGEYSLTISGGNILTIDNAGGYAIDVASVNISAPIIISSSEIAIAAQNGITINSTVKATSTNTCIGTVNGTLAINADITATTSNSAAILSRYGDITINSGTINATGGTTGSWAYGIAATGDIKINAGEVISKGGSKGIYAEDGTITIAPPLVVITAAGGGISDDGHTIVYDNGDPAIRVVIMSPSIPGTVSLSSVPALGNSVGFTVSDDLASAEIENVWQISDDDVSWQDIAEAANITYTPKESEVGKYIRVKVSASNYS